MTTQKRRKNVSRKRVFFDGGESKSYFRGNIQSSSLLSKNINIKIYRTLILPVVLYGCETWSLILREERRLGVSENRCWGEYLGLRGEWRKLHNEELNDLYCSPNIVRVIKSRRMRLADDVARMGEVSDGAEPFVFQFAIQKFKDQDI